ncbi:MAG: enoyl-CoA hydratase/isomerase family protein, partial [Acidobacteriia bacterium]|nr:enoyl-CoA hydratase/isomerase family protein [Terriglobia bacterium]
MDGHDAADTPPPRGGRPDQVGIDRIGRRPSALAATHRVPKAARNIGPAGELAQSDLRIARPAGRGAILHVAADRVRDAIVGGHVIELGDGYPVPVAALVEGRCLGGAFELALCCHFVFAARSAVFACPEIKLGVFPPVLAA